MPLLVTDMTDFAERMREAEQGIVPAELKAKGWRYIDPPTRFSFDMWGYFLGVLGEGEYQILCMSEGPDWKRGQFLMSPKALENLANLSSVEIAKPATE